MRPSGASRALEAAGAQLAGIESKPPDRYGEIERTNS